MPVDPEELESIEKAKRESVAQLLFKAARLFNEIGLGRVRKLTGQNIRNSHAQLFPHIDFEGTRLTELARRVGVTKQAVGQLVGELEKMGVVERVPDPADGRAKLIRFSSRGRRGILDGLGLLNKLEAEFAEEIGEDEMKKLHEGLLRLVPALEKRYAEDC